MKYLHYIGANLYAIDGEKCHPVKRGRGNAYWQTVLKLAKAFGDRKDLAIYGTCAGQRLDGIGRRLELFGYTLGESARKLIADELIELDRGEPIAQR